MSSLVKGLFSNTRKSIDLSSNPLNISIQIRTAKKRVSGSKTNNKDSAGRRLGVKKQEGHFIQTGEIIMRQRGTVIHPGENTSIGVDHTIYATEPGYVRFYLDPFHPLRKYVGVALKKDVRLPKPHFEPRLRRFGYIPIENPIEAEKEEASMSRKELLAQDKLNEIKETKSKAKETFINSCKEALNSVYGMGLEGQQLEDASERLYNIYQLRSVGQSLSEARTQVTFNQLYDINLQVRRNEITKDQVKELQNQVKEFINKIDSAIGVESNGLLYKNLTEEETLSLRKEISEKLAKLYKENALDKEYRKQASELINTPGIFEAKERKELILEYLPEVLPLDVPGSVVEITDAKNAPKDLVIQRIYDEANRKVKLVGRPKEAFATL